MRQAYDYWQDQPGTHRLLCACAYTRTHNPSLSHSFPSIHITGQEEEEEGRDCASCTCTRIRVLVCVGACVRAYIYCCRWCTRQQQQQHISSHNNNINTINSRSLGSLSNIIVLVLVAHTPNHSSPLCSIYYTERERERVRWLPFKQASDCPFSLYMCARKDEYNQQAHTTTMTTTYHHAVLLAKLPSEMDGRNTCALLQQLHITHAPSHLEI